MEKEYCEKLPLAIASVPMQVFENLYCPEVALEKGTMFADLDLPFEGKECRGYDEQASTGKGYSPCQLHHG